MKCEGLPACLQADSQRGQWLVHGAMHFLPHGSEREANGGNRCGKSPPPQAIAQKQQKADSGSFVVWW